MSMNIYSETMLKGAKIIEEIIKDRYSRGLLNNPLTDPLYKIEFFTLFNEENDRYKKLITDSQNDEECINNITNYNNWLIYENKKARLIGLINNHKKYK